MKLMSQAIPSSEAFQTNRKNHLEALEMISNAATLAATGGGEWSRERMANLLGASSPFLETGAGTSEIRRMLIGRELIGAMK